MENLEKKKEAFASLLEIIATLRVGCPWDKKQTMDSLRSFTIEEVYELGDAILACDMAEVKKELGDLLMHIVFYAQIAEEKQLFDISDVLDEICEKLKYRHPHIYGNVQVADEKEVELGTVEIEGERAQASGARRGASIASGFGESLSYSG